MEERVGGSGVWGGREGGRREGKREGGKEGRGRKGGEVHVKNILQNSCTCRQFSSKNAIFHHLLGVLVW